MTNIVLHAKNLTKRYGDLIAVNDLSLAVHEGEIFGFLGPNGAGKTTSINMMCGLLKPDAGQVFIHGKSVVGGGSDIRTRVGVAPQETILWEKLTCLEQLEHLGEMYGLTRRSANRRGSELLETLGLSAKAKELGSQLSGGMKRRLNLALALINDPEILVLDEPEAGLDPQSRLLVREFIRSLARHKTVILTTHNMDEAERMADRVAIVDNGRLVALDTPDALKRTVGEGDVLEIKLTPGSDSKAAAAALRRFELEISTINDGLTVRCRSAVERLPDLLDALHSAGIQTGEVRLRANTLEDVFIALTGRGLRQ